VAAEVEEVVGGADLRHAQQLAPHLGELQLQRPRARTISRAFARGLGGRSARGRACPSPERQRLE